MITHLGCSPEPAPAPMIPVVAVAPAAAARPRAVAIFCRWLPAAALAAAALALCTAGCGGDDAKAAAAARGAQAPAVPVTVGEAVAKTMPVEIAVIGRVEPLQTVAVRAQVGGQLLRVAFQEGQDVDKGALLFAIDPRPYQAALDSAKARLARDQAVSQKADADVRRYTDLVAKEYVTKEQFEQTQATAQSLRATLLEDRAAVESSRLQLDYCTIHAPIGGRTGSLNARAGNLIKPNDDTPMVVIHQIRPIYVSFAVPESKLPEIKRRQEQRQLEVTAAAPETGAAPSRGELTFVDNQVDRTTGTILLKATFQNQDRSLWPGQFVNVVLTLARQPAALVVPARAVQNGQRGQFVFVVKPDRTVEMRPIEVNRTVGAEAVIDRGLAPGERVVTDGQIRLAPGVRVQDMSSPQPASPSGSSSPGPSSSRWSSLPLSRPPAPAAARQAGQAGKALQESRA
jgi:multidrug efflux system membrane fusion protein